ncbi:MAG: phosphatase PAP2 family protein [Bacteroidales bacterium]|nr:phosphatase PAP2 family protein [Bacteroidales bacterium]
MRRKFQKLPAGSLFVIVASIVYLSVMQICSDLRLDHWAIILAFNICFFAGKGSRKFILGFTVFAVFAIVYDAMRIFPNYQFARVDIAGIYNLEKYLFGVRVEGTTLTPSEFFSIHHSIPADLISGFFYLNWIPVPLAFAVYLFFTNKRLFLNFSLTFLFVNLLGFSIYYIHPAAPPWYVAKYGFDFHLNVPGNIAGFSRFDQLVHAKIFGFIYAKNSNVFAALPSLHCAYPMVVLFYGLKARCKWMNIPFATLVLGIWFAAVYSGHHYVIDVIMGIVCAIIGIALYEYVLLKWPGYQRFLEKYIYLIS